MDAILAFGWWALQFTPRVARAGDAVVFEVSDSDRLFGGRQQLIEQVHASSLELGPVKLTQAATSLLALAQLQLDPADYRGPDRLPLATLLEVREHLPTLNRLGCTAIQTLRRHTYEGMSQRYPQGIPAKVQEQVEHELKQIAELKYEMYFLTVHDIVRFARQQNILCQGRGSAANSAVCYCLYVTEIDPERTNLLFERFISRERNEPPYIDIDIDFEHQRREEGLPPRLPGSTVILFMFAPDRHPSHAGAATYRYCSLGNGHLLG